MSAFGKHQACPNIDRSKFKLEMAPTDSAKFTGTSAQHGRLVSYSMPAPGLSLADFLRQAHGLERVYWENNRNGHAVAFAGFGVAAELVAWLRGYLDSRYGN